MVSPVGSSDSTVAALAVLGWFFLAVPGWPAWPSEFGFFLVVLDHLIDEELCSSSLWVNCSQWSFPPLSQCVWQCLSTGGWCECLLPIDHIPSSRWWQLVGVIVKWLLRLLRAQGSREFHWLVLFGVDCFDADHHSVISNLEGLLYFYFTCCT